MRDRLFAMPIAAALATSLSGCSAAPTDEASDLATAANEVTACPQTGSSEAVMRTTSSLAYNLMRLAAKVGGPVAPYYSNTILAAQRYKIRSSGTGIEFRTTDTLYKYVTNEMKGILDLAQMDADVAKFLSDGQRAAYQTNGWWFPSVNAISALANFKSPGPTTTAIPDLLSVNNSHKATVTSSEWCGGDKILITETVQQEYAFSPLQKRQITNAPGNTNNGPVGDWLNAPPPEFTNPTNNPYGGNVSPSTPFNGPSSNPYLVISLTTKGVTKSWANFDWSSDNCYNYYPSFQCTGYLEIDPVPYAEPGAFYNPTGAVGTQNNPYTIVGTIWASADHQGQWATRSVNGAKEMGQFLTARTSAMTGITQYGYVKKY